VRVRYFRSHEQRTERYREKDQVYQQEKRAKVDPHDLIEQEYRARLEKLRTCIARRQPDKRLEQLRGREEEVALVGKAMKLATLEHGARTSDAKIAATFAGLPGGRPYTRHQACTTRLLIEKLEAPGAIWSSFGSTRTPPGA
jgi:hypothetical protein